MVCKREQQHTESHVVNNRSAVDQALTQSMDVFHGGKIGQSIRPFRSGNRPKHVNKSQKVMQHHKHEGHHRSNQLIGGEGGSQRPDGDVEHTNQQKAPAHFPQNAPE